MRICGRESRRIWRLGRESPFRNYSNTYYLDLPADFVNRRESLLHIRNGVNAIEYRDFYLTGRGNAVIAPERELRATLDHFIRAPEGGCRYPDRY